MKREDIRTHIAALTIQAHWKEYREIKELEKMERWFAAFLIQDIWREEKMKRVQRVRSAQVYLSGRLAVRV